MTIKELKHNILLSLYHRYKKNKLSRIGLKDLCDQESLIFDSPRQVTDAAKGLKEDGYIKLELYSNGDGLISSLTPSGIEHVEEHLLSPEKPIIDKTRIGIKLFATRERYKDIVDANATPCFGVDAVADCYAKQLDKITSSKTDNIRMMGIFGPWGRGKTYFYKRLKKNLSDRHLHTIKYKFVEFNAWKYQETPVLWAYLYETIYKSATCSDKIYNLIRNTIFTKNVLIYIIVLCIGWIMGWITSILSNETIVQVLSNAGLPISAIYLFSGIIYLFVEKPTTARGLINKYTKRKSYKNYMGIQNEIEEDLQKLLKCMITPSKSRMILYVDDIDRCNSQKMISLIDSLRIILENTEIQKRLIVICSVDEEKLIRAYFTMIKNNVDDSEKALLLAKEHLDKLFIFGIKLAALDSIQQLHYLKTLMKDSNSEPTNYTTSQDEQQTETPFSTFRYKESFVATSTSEETPNLNDEKIEELFKDFIHSHHQMRLTPRKIRIMYYQLLFATNISSKGGGVFTSKIAETMLKKSAGLEYEEDTETAMSDIIEMAAPY